MEGCSKNGESCPQLLDLIPEESEWLVKRDHDRSSEDKKLELRLGPPGEDWSLEEPSKNNKQRDESSLLSLGHFTNRNQPAHKFSSPQNSQAAAGVWFNQQQQQQRAKVPAFLPFPSTTSAKVPPQNLPAMAKQSSQSSCFKVVVDKQHSAANTAVPPNSSQKRTAPGPVVGWPPIRSFRKNLASGSSSKPAFESQNGNSNKKIASEKPVETCSKGLLVKINMDGVPIGRKVDLRANDSYEKLSTAVDELFRGFLAAQRDSSAGGITNNQEEEKAITGLMDGSGEYTLVYEDNEGDRMLVGDVPWHMFVSTVKRLRVLKSSEVETSKIGISKQVKLPLK
uniref:Auxin-responsive protein n=1 Tax=Rhizophora mucronata TaxID=61149 RepID=A0A2P2KZV7_RHIMU